jgi:hypothetical protein
MEATKVLERKQTQKTSLSGGATSMNFPEVCDVIWGVLFPIYDQGEG